jgi:hypothetical protein
MAQYFGQYRCVELSTVQYIETSLASSWTGVSVCKGYPNFDKVSVPVVSVSVLSNNPNFLEIGSRQLFENYLINIEIFSKSDGQRLDIAQTIKNTVLTDWVYYVYSNNSDNSDIERVSSGKIKLVSFVQNDKREFFDNVSIQDRYRHIISINVTVGLS